MLGAGCSWDVGCLMLVWVEAIMREEQAVSGPTLWNSLPLSARDPSLTLTQFCACLKTVLFCRAYETLTWRLRDSLGCKDCCVNTNSLTYTLGMMWSYAGWLVVSSRITMRHWWYTAVLTATEHYVQLWQIGSRPRATGGVQMLSLSRPKGGSKNDFLFFFQ